MKLDFNDTVQMIWSDGINSLYQDHHHQKEKVVTSQVGSSEGLQKTHFCFVEKMFQSHMWTIKMI